MPAARATVSPMKLALALLLQTSIQFVLDDNTGRHQVRDIKRTNRADVFEVK